MPFFGSTDILTANSTWQSDNGVGRPTDYADSISGMVFASHAGTLFVEQSADGVNYDISKSIAVSATTGTPFSESLYGAYVRLRYTNSGTNQTTFRIAARYTSAGATV